MKNRSIIKTDEQRKTIKGFTIVELLIVIVVIGILAAIVIVAYNGIQKRAMNTGRMSELKSWQKSFEAYKATYGQYPDLTNDGYCLGTGFPSGKCRNYTQPVGSVTHAENTTLVSELAKITSTPSGNRAGLGSAVIGPFVVYNTSTVVLYGIFEGSGSDCPQGTTFDYAGTAGSAAVPIVQCIITLTK